MDTWAAIDLTISLAIVAGAITGGILVGLDRRRYRRTRQQADEIMRRLHRG